jgi:hypothetical protein
MFLSEDAKTIKKVFAEVVDEDASAHKVIAAAKAMRELYNSLPEDEQTELIAWVRLHSDLDAFVAGTDNDYYIKIAVPRKGLRRANLEHLERYSSEATETIAAVNEDDDEYSFNIWRSQWGYIEQFLKQYDLAYRIVSDESRSVSPEVS